MSQIENRTNKLRRIGRKILRDLDLPKIRAAFLYGSALGASFRPDSDIDIAVLDCEDDRLTWREQALVMDTLERALGRDVDLRSLRDISISHQAHILEQGQLLWGPDETEVAWYSRHVLALAEQEREGSRAEWDDLLDRGTRHQTVKL